MKPILVLIVVFFLTAGVRRWTHGAADWNFAGSLSFAAMLLFTSLGHFLFPVGMAAMIPDVFPYKTFLVYATGVLEIAFAVGLFLPQTRVQTGWIVIVFLLLILPANIKGAMDGVNYEQPGAPGPGLTYLWFRIPLQVLFIAWVYVFSIRHYFHHPA